MKLETDRPANQPSNGRTFLYHIRKLRQCRRACGLRLVFLEAQSDQQITLRRSVRQYLCLDVRCIVAIENF